MTIQEILEPTIKNTIKKNYQVEIENLEFQPTRKDFEGDITLVIFPMLSLIKQNPQKIGEQIGEDLVKNTSEVKKYNVVKGFLNLTLFDDFYIDDFNTIYKDENYGLIIPKSDAKTILVEYSSPNTNKPLHLGHIRNNLLGYSVAEILKAAGNNTHKTQIINDRGIHICKSMVAWKKFGNDQTPITTQTKGDHFVGKYYVEFDKAYKKQTHQLIEEGKTEDEAKKEAPILVEAQEMLKKWETSDETTVQLWKTMNQWVYDGFKITYKNLGVDFDSFYYESDTYLLGKKIVEEGLQKGIFYKKDDGSVWIDLTDEGLDEKLLLRADGTAVYMTQDLGTAIQRVTDHKNIGGMVYTVGNEQDYHFNVLFLILKKLGFDWAENLYHLSYGMVDLPSGKMKSREGTVVDADDLLNEMTKTAEAISKELGKLDGYSEGEKQKLYKTIGLGALKYFILKVDPKKRILFDPEASVDFNGNTGPFIQYTYARIQSILRKTDFDYSKTNSNISLHQKEKELIKQLQFFPEVIENAAKTHSPALIANYTYDLVKTFNSFYQNISILGAETTAQKIFRVQLSKKVAQIIKSAFSLLGIDVPERM